jgi:hypothetical protein
LKRKEVWWVLAWGTLTWSTGLRMLPSYIASLCVRAGNVGFRRKRPSVLMTPPLECTTPLYSPLQSTPPLITNSSPFPVTPIGQMAEEGEAEYLRRLEARMEAARYGKTQGRRGKRQADGDVSEASFAASLATLNERLGGSGAGGDGGREEERRGREWRAQGMKEEESEEDEDSEAEDRAADELRAIPRGRRQVGVGGDVESLLAGDGEDEEGGESWDVGEIHRPARADTAALIGGRAPVLQSGGERERGEGEGDGGPCGELMESTAVCMRSLQGVCSIQ